MDLISRAIKEDRGPGDVTGEAVIPEDAQARATILQKEPGVLFGLDYARIALEMCGVTAFDALVVEGQWRDEVPANAARASGPARWLLQGERVALNFLGHLSGIAL